MSEIENRIAAIRLAMTRLRPRPAPEGDFCSASRYLGNDKYENVATDEPTIAAITRETGLIGVTRDEIVAAIRRQGTKHPAVRVK